MKYVYNLKYLKTAQNVTFTTHKVVITVKCYLVYKVVDYQLEVGHLIL